MLFMIPITVLRFIVGKKIDFFVSLLGGCAAGYSIFVKLSAFYNDQTANMKMSYINLIYAAATILLFIFVQYLCYKN